MRQQVGAARKALLSCAVYIEETPTERQTDRQTDRQAGRQVITPLSVGLTPAHITVLRVLTQTTHRGEE